MSHQPDLAQLQRWMQAVIMHPGGVAAGVESPTACEHLDIADYALESVIARSRQQTSAERLEIYARAYYARLLECLQNEFPMLAAAVGEDVFNRFAVGYLECYPSGSYTLGKLGKHFGSFLAETRPRDDNSWWPDFLVDLVRFEACINEVFDAPGAESLPPLTAEQLQSVRVEDWPQCRLRCTPCLRLLEFEHSIREYYRGLRSGQQPLPPERKATWLAVSRRDYIVRHYELSRPQYVLLAQLLQGATIGEAIEHCAEFADDLEALSQQLAQWFRDWTAEGFFLAIEPPK
jgi:hypothetical protein